MDEDREAIKNYIEQNVKITDLLDVYSLSYKQVAANRIKMCCPFHEENTPSLMIYLDNNSFHCFGCARNGNSLTFLMYYNKKSFNEVLDMYQDKAQGGETLIFEKVDRSLQTRDMDFNRYVRSNKYRLGVFLRGLIYSKPEKWAEIDAIHREMDNFFDNEKELDKKTVEEFMNSIMGRVTK